MGNGVLIDLAEREFHKVCAPFDIVVQTIYDSHRSHTLFSFTKLWRGEKFFWNMFIEDEAKILYRGDEERMVTFYCMNLFRHFMFAFKRRLN